MKQRLLILLLLVSSPIFSQNAGGNLEVYIDNIIDGIPGGSGNDYKNPSTEQSEIWENIIEFILAEDITNARIETNKIGYQVTEFTDNTENTYQIFYILEKKSTATNHWGTYVFTKKPQINNLIITAPHVKNDINTGQQAIYCLKRTKAKAVFLNGTERCNSSFYSMCSGSTTTCNNGSESFRISDVAHAEESIFHQTTDILFQTISNSVFIQLHGFAKNTEDPFLIISNGTRKTPSTDYIELLKNALLLEDSSLTFKIPHKDTSWDRLIAFTNTQGRLINGATRPCNNSPSSTTGRFISIEQELTKLREDVTGWSKMGNALLKVFPTTLAVNQYPLNTSISISPNPTLGKILIHARAVNKIEIYNLYGQRIGVHDLNSENNPTIDLTHESRGVYHLKIRTEDGLALKKVIHF